MEKRLQQSVELLSKSEAITQKEPPEIVTALVPEEIQKTVHDLRVYQSELEMQNEELRKTQEQLEVEKERYFNLYDLAPVGYITISEVGQILEINLTAATMLGQPRGMLINTYFTQFIPKEYQDIYYLQCKQNPVSREPSICELQLIGQGGLAFWVHLAIIALPQMDDVTEYRIAMSDITDRKKAEEALKQSEQLRLSQIKAANESLELTVELRTRELQETYKKFLHAEKLSAIGRLSASIAHEFNNPLQSIMSILNGLKKRAVLVEEDKELLDAAIVESVRVKDLIRNLQEFNRPSTGKKVLTDMHLILDSLLLLNKHDFHVKNISIERNYAERLPQILVVPDQIKQVFLNLLINAGDACQQGGGVITVSTSLEKGRVAIAIKDTGIGIKPENMEQIFQPFYSTKPEVKGTGLGLSVCNGIIQYHQGEIRVESQPGEGATFTVLLPIKDVRDS